MTAPAGNPPARPVAVLGARGQIGYELVRTLMPYAPVRGYGHDEIDLADTAATAAALSALNPGVIVNAAGYTAVDAAESDRDTAMLLNGTVPGQLAALAAELGACFVHYSSDYVFDGEASVAYRESDPTGPISYYGATKLAGDRAVEEHGDAAIVLRTAWVYGRRGRNFMLTMQRLARERDSLSVVDDQVGCPTSARYIAAATGAILSHCGFSSERMREYRGVYHLAAAGAVSWCGFARAILARTPGLEATTVEPIPAEAYPTPAARPRRSELDCSLVTTTFGLHRPGWETLLDRELEA